MVISRTARETRIHRGCSIDSKLDSIFSDTTLSVGKTTCQPKGSITLDPITFATAPISLSWASSRSQFEALKKTWTLGVGDTGLAPQHTSILVTGTSTYLKSTAVLLDTGEEGPSSLNFRETLADASDRRSLFEGGSGKYEICVALVLNKSLSVDRISRPSRKGYWLARATYTISNEKHWPLWQPQPLTDDVRQKFNLGDDTVSFVELDDSDILAPSGESPATIWLNEDIWDALVTHNTRKETASFGWHLMMQFVREILFRYSEICDQDHTTVTTDSEEDLLRDSLIGALITAISGNGATREDKLDWLRRAREEPGYVAALAEDTLKVKKPMLAALTDL